MDDMVGWSEDEPMEDEQVPHLLGNLPVLGSFGMDDSAASPGPPRHAMELEGDDPLSLKDSVFNPSPLVLSVTKIQPDEQPRSVESSTNATKAPPPTPDHMQLRFCMTDQQAPRPRMVSESSDMMVDSKRLLRRRSSHRRDSVDSLPTATDLDKVIMGFHILS